MKIVKGNKGFTLIEIVAAMVILAIVAVPLGKTFIDSFKYQARSQIKTEANKVIEYVAEQLKNGKYGELASSLETKLKSWASEENSSNIEFDVDTLPDEYGVLTGTYKVTLESNGKPTVVQEGGVGTPANGYDLTLEIDDLGGYSIPQNGDYLTAEYIMGNGNPRLEIRKTHLAPLNSDVYAVLIKNKSTSAVTIDVRKIITDKVTIYTSGADINLRTYADPTLSKDQKTFQKVKLGEKENIDDKKEYFYTVKVTAVNKEDSSITATMNVTFNVKI